MGSDETNKPAKRWHAGSVWAAVWTNEVEIDGRRTTRTSVSFERRYQDSSRNKEWKSSKVFFARDLGNLKLLVEKAQEFMVLGEGANTSEAAST